MSRLEKFLAGWSFRTSTPAFEEGQEIAVVITGRDDGGAVARIGDSLLHVTDVPDGEDPLDTRARVRVTSFDASSHTGEAEYLERLGGTAF